MEERTLFKIIVYLEDYDIGTSVAVHQDMPWMDVYEEALNKLNIQRPQYKEPIVKRATRWCYARCNSVSELGMFWWGDAVTITLWNSEFP